MSMPRFRGACYAIAPLVALVAFGCSQETTRVQRPADEIDVQPAASEVHPAEATGYIDAVDPEAFPPMPGSR